MRYLVHGLVVEVDVALNLASADDRPADLVLHAESPRLIPAEQPDGSLVAARSVGGHKVAFLVRRGTSCVQRLPGHFEATIDVSTGVGTYVCDERADDIAAILLPDTVLAGYLLVRGELVLHASAVYVQELAGAVAFVGSAGRGKSTLATLLGVAGAPLLTDDALRVELGNDGDAVSRRGAATPRLRPSTWPLLDELRIPTVPTVDGRRSAAVPVHGRDEPLRCLVLPSPNRAATAVTLRRLAPVEAFMTITRHPRILGWSDPTVIERQFSLTTELVRRVPMWEATVPWGPPFPPRLATQLLDVLGAQRR